MWTLISFIISFLIFILLFALVVGLFTFVRMGIWVRGMGKRLRQRNPYNSTQGGTGTKDHNAATKKVIVENIIKESAGKYVDYEEVPKDSNESRQ